MVEIAGSLSRVAVPLPPSSFITSKSSLLHNTHPLFAISSSSSSSMAAAAPPSSAACLGGLNCTHHFLSPKSHVGLSLLTKQRSLTIVAMAPKTKVNKYDDNWEKKWFGAGIFFEGSEELKVDVFKKLEEKKVLSNVEKAGLLSKAEELGFTLSSIEKLGVFSKAEELGLLSLLEKVASVSPSTLASAALPILVAAVAAVVVIPDDSAGLVAAQAVLAGTLAAGGVGLFVGSVVLGGLQENS